MATEDTEMDSTNQRDGWKRIFAGLRFSGALLAYRLWALWHSVHHSSPEYDITTSLCLSFFDGLLAKGFYQPAILLGVESVEVFGATAFVIGYQTWIHTELIQKMPRWFEAVF